ncbi:golgin candidate 6 isoform X2 [Tanacetum coccineum]
MAMKGGRKNLKRAVNDETLTLLEGQSIMQAVSLRGNNQIEPDEESTGSTSIHLEESSREPNAKRSVNSELGFPVCSSKSENHQEPSGSLSLTVHSPSTLKRHARPKLLCTHETDGDNPHNMEAYTLPQLRAIARERRLKCCSGVRKSSEASSYKNLAEKMETDLKSLSDAYNSLEEANYQLEMEVRALKSGGATPSPDIEKIKTEAREEAQKESEGELGDLLVCLGQEQTKVEKLSARLLELGEDVDALLEGIRDDTGLAS